MRKLELLDWHEVGRRLSLSRWPIHKRIQVGLFVKPIPIAGEKSVRFPAHEVDAIVAALIAGKDEAQIRELVVKLESERTGRPATPRRKRTAEHAPIAAAA